MTIRLGWNEPPREPVVTTLHLRNPTGSAKPREIAVTGSEVSTQLPAGQWLISASSTNYWSEPTLISVADGPADANVTLYRAARVKARVTVPAGEVRSVDVYFNPTEPAPGRPASSTSCPVAAGQLDCDLPAGLHDLAFRVPGHGSLYRWDVDLREKPSVDVGKLAFRRGATLSGRVELEEPADEDPIEVTLRNAVGGDRNDALRERQAVTGMVTRPNKRGFFAFDVLPGSYLVSASTKRLVSEERQVTVMEGREAILEEALRLARLLTLTVNVQLPPEGAKMPWKLAVTRLDAEGHPSPEQVIGVPSDGICKFERQLTGSYSIELRIKDSVWAAESSFLERDHTIDMPVKITKVRGSIHLGDNPLQAALMFLSSRKGFRIPVRSRSDGTFRLFLPGVTGELWEQVEIESAQPRVKRSLENVSLHIDDEGVATIDLRLPAAAIQGTVVDENGHPVAEGFVNITTPDGFQQHELTGGTFSIEGLESGRYALTAATPERETEDPLFVELAETGQDVILKVAPVSRLQGSIAAASGPVIGASVFVGVPNDAHSIVGSIPVDTTGTFDFRLPPQTRDVLLAVTAPGFSFRMMRVPVRGSKMDVVVDQNGGVLTVDGRVGAKESPLRPYLIHNGAILSGVAVAYLSRGRLLASPEERLHFEIPSAEEGSYSLCLLSEDEERGVRFGARPPETRCASGVLARHGSLNLRAP